MTLPGPSLTPDTIVAWIGDVFARRGAEEYLGEVVTIGEHMLQGAAIAEQDGQPDEIVAAALLHDIGHFTSELGTFSMDDTEDRFHEAAGAQLLEPWFPEAVVECVRHHVAAKRYLCFARPEYFKALSPASVHSLKLQGGPMNAKEAQAFAQNPHLEAILQVRFLDEAGKRKDFETSGFDHYAPLLQRLVDQHTKV